MSNMSYCRFHNTRIDVVDCLDAIDEQAVESKEEVNNGIAMFKKFLDFCIDEGIVQEYDEKKIKKLLNEALISYD